MFRQGHWVAGGLLIFLLTGVLIGILYHGMRMLCDNPKRKPLGDLLGKIDVPVLAVLLLLTCVVGAGFEQISWLNNLLNNAVKVIGG
jgi:hydrogenase-4 component F